MISRRQSTAIVATPISRYVRALGSLCVPTALLSMMSCALVLAAMMVLGLAARAPVKMERMKLMVGDGWVGGWMGGLKGDVDVDVCLDSGRCDVIPKSLDDVIIAGLDSAR